MHRIRADLQLHGHTPVLYQNGVKFLSLFLGSGVLTNGFGHFEVMVIFQRSCLEPNAKSKLDWSLFNNWLMNKIFMDIC